MLVQNGNMICAIVPFLKKYVSFLPFYDIAAPNHNAASIKIINKWKHWQSSRALRFFLVLRCIGEGIMSFYLSVTALRTEVMTDSNVESVQTTAPPFTHSAWIPRVTQDSKLTKQRQSPTVMFHVKMSNSAHCLRSAYEIAHVHL